MQTSKIILGLALSVLTFWMQSSEKRGNGKK
jgi:hypothetical protein